jgi:hypothetical protein
MWGTPKGSIIISTSSWSPESFPIFWENAEKQIEIENNDNNNFIKEYF